MGIVRSQYLTCNTCGTSFAADLADSVNATRFPATREQILAGTLHRARCPHCGTEVTVEKAFNYVDLARRTVIAVYPRHERHTWRDAAGRLERARAQVPAELLDGDAYVRVVFGLAELREKLVAQDAQLDDRDVEVLKALVVYDHPVLLQRPRLRLHLTAAAGDGLEFKAGYDHDDRRFRVVLPWSQVEALLSGGTLRSWEDQAHPKDSLYEGGEPWVNMWRWSPGNHALAALAGYDADLAAGRDVDLAGRRFEQMVTYLPRGNHLPSWAKAALRRLFEHVRARSGTAELQDALFEIRFDRGLEDEWSLNNDPDDIPTLWDLLKDLPDAHVEGNTKLNELFLEPGGGGWYEPGSGDIHIGSGTLADREEFQDVMRHEVGHAVHEAHPGLVNGWLASRFGWRVYDSTAQGVDAWVAEMDGWGAASPAERAAIRQLLVTALGPGGSWTPGPAPNPPPGHAWWRADFGPRLAYANTGAHWFTNHRRWYRHGGKAFFLNFYYRAFMSVDDACLQLVAQMPSDYAAMSHFEFFAELYALHHDLNDPKRPAIPPDVLAWLDGNLGPAATGMPARPAATLGAAGPATGAAEAAAGADGAGAIADVGDIARPRLTTGGGLPAGPDDLAYA